MRRFISCDWGTTALRLWLVDASDMSVSAKTDSINGISTTFESWKKTGGSENERLSFYHSVLTEQIKRLEEQINSPLDDVPLIISGMASSSIGMIELPYKEIPFSTEGTDLNIQVVDASLGFNHIILIISGAKTNEDAMRGEETQLIGSLQGKGSEGFFIFPGTHSKHITVKERKVIDVKTYMTGEFFELLSKKSILSNSVEEGNDLNDEQDLESFGNGVLDAVDSNLLHSSFLVRTNSLFGTLSAKENYYYLSGLLIGTEIKELEGINIPVTIVGSELLLKYYTAALAKLGLQGIKYHHADKAVINGQCRIFNLYHPKLVALVSINNK